MDAAVRHARSPAPEGSPAALSGWGWPLLGTDEGADIEFEPERLGLTARTPDL
jgi:plasmid stability protein